MNCNSHSNLQLRQWDVLHSVCSWSSSPEQEAAPGAETHMEIREIDFAFMWLFDLSAAPTSHGMFQQQSVRELVSLSLAQLSLCQHGPQEAWQGDPQGSREEGSC